MLLFLCTIKAPLRNSFIWFYSKYHFDRIFSVLVKLTNSLVEPKTYKF
jgi:hypothetical protein